MIPAVVIIDKRLQHSSSLSINISLIVFILPTMAGQIGNYIPFNFRTSLSYSFCGKATYPTSSDNSAAWSM